MPITTIDRNTALVIIDLQQGIKLIPTVHPLGAVASNAAKLAAAFRKRGAPVVLVNVAGLSPGRTDVKRPMPALPANWADLLPELDAQASDLRVTKYAMGAFYGTPLDFLLRRRSVTQIVLCGIATSSGVESTARGAHDRGYHVTLVTDAMTDFDSEGHANSLARVFPRIGETGTVDDVLALVERG
jgi:nicotinamidase-related amidase